MRKTIAALSTILAACAHDSSAGVNELCGPLIRRTVFELTSEHSLARSVKRFTLCTPYQNQSLNLPAVLFLQTTGHEPQATGGEAKIEIGSDVYRKLLGLYEKALGFNAHDWIEGLDGSQTCLVTNRGNNSIEACFWSIDVRTANRGLDGLKALEDELFEVVRKAGR